MATPALVSAAATTTDTIQNEVACGTSQQTFSSSDCTASVTTGNATNSVGTLISEVIDIFSWLVGGISVIMIIYGGFRYVTSGGNDSSISGAKNTIIYALIGLVIVALAQVIVHFVLAKAFSVSSGGTTPVQSIYALHLFR
jgi:TRAP-type C4-dicarboxylate transport system permease small subunit